VFSLAINIAIIILLIVDIVMEYKKIKIVRQNIEINESLKEKVREVQINIHSYVEDKEKNSISIEDLVETVAKRLKDSLKQLNK